MRRLEIRALGGLIVTCDGKTVTGFDTRKVPAILVYLACTQRCHAREVLAEMFWPNRQLHRALGNLRVAIHSLRETVGRYVTITRDTVMMNADSDWWLDVNEVEQAFIEMGTDERAVNSNKAASLRYAIDLYCGDFLDGFFVKGSAPFEYWTLLKRDQLRFQTVCALDQVVGHCIAQKAYSAGIAYVTTLLQMDPLREKTHRQLMTLLTHSDQRAAASVQFERYQRWLACDDGGAAPMLETNALINEIRMGMFL